MILYGTQASFAWPCVSLGIFVTAIFGASSLFRFHGICWIRFALLGKLHGLNIETVLFPRSRRCNVRLGFEFRENRRVGKRVHVIWRLAIEQNYLFS